MKAPTLHPPPHRLAAFASGLLDDGESADIETHLEACDHCCAELDAARRRRRRPAPVPAPPPRRGGDGRRLVPDPALGRGRPAGRARLRDPRRTRPRRHGGRLQGAADAAQPRRRPQDDPGRGARRAGRARPLPGRGRGGGPASSTRTSCRSTRSATHDGLPYLALEYLPTAAASPTWPAARRCPAEPPRLVETLARAVARRPPGRRRPPRPQAGQRPAHGRAASPRSPTSAWPRRPDDDRGLTRTGASLGTPAYMAPEQAGGSAGGRARRPTCTASGPSSTNCSTGRPPFRGDTALETIRRVCSDDPVPPRRLRPDVPRDLETVCLKCLRKEPRHRYPSADALADDLGRFLEGRPVTARPVGTLEAGCAPPPPAGPGRPPRRRPPLGGRRLPARDGPVAGGRRRHGDGPVPRGRRPVGAERVPPATGRAVPRTRRRAGQPGRSRGRAALDAREPDDFPRGRRRLPADARANLADWSRHAVRPLYYHDVREVRSVAFRPEGKVFALGDFHARVRFFETDTGRQVGPTIDTGEKHVRAWPSARTAPASPPAAATTSTSTRCPSPPASSTPPPADWRAGR